MARITPTDLRVWLEGLPRRPTRVEMAHRYADLLLQHWNAWERAGEWGPLNASIVAQWSVSGLEWIKRAAWHAAQATRRSQARCP